MSTSNDTRYVEDAGVAFAIYCDTNGLTQEERARLADEMARELETQAEYTSPLDA